MIAVTPLTPRNSAVVDVRRKVAQAAALVVAIVVMSASLAQPPGAAGAPPRATVPIKELMETTITTASNAIWNTFDPPTSDEQWAALEQAALALIDAAKINGVGGTGPMDNEWVKHPAWKPFNDTMLQASEAALAAVRGKDHAALLNAGDVLYGPCEGCHAQFNPGVVNQN